MSGSALNHLADRPPQTPTALFIFFFFTGLGFLVAIYIILRAVRARRSCVI